MRCGLALVLHLRTSQMKCREVVGKQYGLAGGRRFFMKSLLDCQGVHSQRGGCIFSNRTYLEIAVCAGKIFFLNYIIVPV